MKNFVKKLISFLCSVCLSFAVFAPFILVKADTVTYFAPDAPFLLFSNLQNYGVYTTNNNVRFYGLDTGTTTTVYAITLVYNSSYFKNSNNGFGYVENNITQSSSYGGTTYYYQQVVQKSLSDGPTYPHFAYDNSFSNFTHQAYYFTFGDGAIEPEPEIVFGNLADVSYSSNIAGSGSESSNNVDVITWNNVVDNHNNLVPSDAVVDIRAIPGEYQASDKQSLLTKIYTDLILDYTSFATLANVPFSNGQKAFTWSDVVSRFGNPWVFGNFISMIQGESYWYKQGWIYEVRLRIPSEEFIGEWIGIRNLTSSGVQNSNNAIDNNGLNSTLVQTINNVNNINSTENNNFVTNNNYYYNEYPIPANSSDLSSLTSPLQAILDAILSIPRKIGEKIQEVLNNIYEWLFVYEFDIEDYEEQKNRMLEESGAFGEILTHLETMKENIDSHNGASYVPLISWSDVYVMDEVMIPAGTFNLGSLVAEDPMRTFYLLYQTIVSGYLYFTLFRFLYKKIIKTLRT